MQIVIRNALRDKNYCSSPTIVLSGVVTFVCLFSFFVSERMELSEPHLWTHPLCPLDSLSNSSRKNLSCSFIKQNEGLTLFLGKSLELREIGGIKILQNRPALCQDQTDLLILITSLASNKEVRDTLRSTWLNTSLLRDPGMKSRKPRPKIRYTFVTGTGKDQYNNHVTEEARVYDDVIQFDSIDRGTFDLTTKTAIALNWARDYCVNAKYLLKIHELVMMNPLTLVKFQEQLQKEASNWVYGTPGKISRDKATVKALAKMAFHAGTKTVILPLFLDGQFAIPSKIWPWDDYPEHIASSGFLLDKEALLSLTAIMGQVPYFPFDNVFFTGILPPLAEVAVQSSDRFIQPHYKKEFWKNNFALGYVSANIKNMEIEWKELLGTNLHGSIAAELLEQV